MHTHHFGRHRGPPIAVRIGLAAAAGAAISYYLFGTESGRKRREGIKRFAHTVKDKANDFKDRAGETVSELADVSKDVYSEMSDIIKDKYADLKELNKEELSDVAREIRNRWQEASGEIQKIIDDAVE